MKNFSTLFGIIAIGAVIVVCLAFTACPEDTTEYSLNFSNASAYKIEVICPGATPGNFELRGVITGSAPEKQVVTKKGKISYSWNIEGKNKEQSLIFVKATVTGTGVLFEDNDD